MARPAMCVVIEQLRKLKALRSWIILPGRKRIRLYYPRSHKRFAQKYQEAIDQVLKYEGLLAFDVDIAIAVKTPEVCT